MSETKPEAKAEAKPEEAKAAASTLGAKEWITFLFSTLALVISSATFYYTNLRVEDRAEMRLSTHEFTDDGILLSVAFVNSGNRPAVVMKASYMLSYKSHGDKSSEVIDDGTFPLLLPPRDIKIASILVPNSDIVEGANEFRDTDERGDVIRYAHLNLETVNSRGQLFQLRSKPLIRIGIKDGTVLYAVWMHNPPPIYSLLVKPYSD